MSSSTTPTPEVLERHNQRLYRLACHKRRTLGLAHWLAKQGLLTPRLARLQQCQSWMVFRYYPVSDCIRMLRTVSCDLPLLCPLCAIRRAARTGYAYQQRVCALLAKDPSLILSYAVLTIRNQADLSERFQHLQSHARLLIARRRASCSALRGHAQFAYAHNSCFVPVTAGAYSFEVKRGRNSGLWHPHLNLLLLSRHPIDSDHLTAEWQSLTQDSYITYCQPRPP
jgi:hypothetical protein